MLRLLLSVRDILPLQVQKLSAFKRSLLQKILIDDELVGFYYIHVAHTNILDKICNFLVLLNYPNTKLIINFFSKMQVV